MSGLLTGIRVLDLTHMLAGPYGAMLLADLGADIIKIERPEYGDGSRLEGPPFIEGHSVYFQSINRSKRSVTLDLSKPEGRNIFYELAKKSDVVFDNFRPGVLEKLKIDYDQMKAINARIISCSVSAFGSSGPLKSLPSFDLAIQAMGGGMSITGHPDSPPTRMGLPIGDLAGGMFAALAISAALTSRERTGCGSRIELALLDCQVALLTYIAHYFFSSGVVPGPVGSGHPSVVPYQAFRTADGYIVVAIFTDKFWVPFCRVLELEHLANDSRFDSNQNRISNRGLLVPILEERFQTKTTEEWANLLGNSAVPSAPILRIDEVLSHRQVIDRNMVVEIPYPALGTKLKAIGTPIKVSDSGDQFRAAPGLGEHTFEVLGELLGFSEAQLVRLKKAAVI